jgi:hypothetical protein
MSNDFPPPQFPPRQSNAFLRAMVEVGRSFRRVLACNFQKTRVTEGEHAKMAFSRSPITSPIVQSYVAWRKSALWITTIALSIHAIVLFVSFERTETAVRRSTRETVEKQLEQQRKQNRSRAERSASFRLSQPSSSERRRQERRLIENREDKTVENLGQSNLTLIDILTWIGHGGIIVGIILVLLSAIFWSNLPRSRVLARWGWGIMFLVPVILAFLPVSTLMDFSHIDSEETRKTLVRSLGTLVALSVFVGLGAKVVAIFPGVIRSSMALKTLLPESAVPGWIVSLIAPIYMLVLMLLLVTINQIGGSVLLIIGALCLMLGPMVYVVCAKAIVRPHSAREVSTVVNRIRFLAVSFSLSGIIMVSIFILDLEILELSDVLNFVLSVVGTVLLLTVVVTDLVVNVLKYGYLQGQGFQESQLREMLDRRFRALAEIGKAVAIEGENDLAPPPLPPPKPARKRPPGKKPVRRKAPPALQRPKPPIPLPTSPTQESKPEVPKVKGSGPEGADSRKSESPKNDDSP